MKNLNKVEKETARNIIIENLRIIKMMKESKAALTRKSFDKDYKKVKYI
jgi:hypothetical protein